MTLSISSRTMTLCALALAAVFTDTAAAQTHGPRAQCAARPALDAMPANTVTARERTAGPRDTVRVTREPDAPAQFASLDFRATAAPVAPRSGTDGCDRRHRAGPRNTIARCN